MNLLQSPRAFLSGFIRSSLSAKNSLNGNRSAGSSGLGGKVVYTAPASAAEYFMFLTSLKTSLWITQEINWNHMHEVVHVAPAIQRGMKLRLVVVDSITGLSF